ncbi:MAG: DUF4124 domain-containing protein [Candidatus Thiodiazotropha sp. (ex Codakia rugifera)]|nr:DUF4124 domain-containing protein [Candidatus Thiodiazotropha sp. (ex Codakia rugifera)]
MESVKRLLWLSCLLLLALTFPAQAAMYKWYDEDGKVNYTQTPPPKGSRRASINTETFNTLEMRKVPTRGMRKVPKSSRTYRKPASQKRKKTPRRCSRR